MNQDDIKLKDMFFFLIAAPWFIGGFGGFLVLFRQFFFLIKRGEWEPFSAIDLLRQGFDSIWLFNPTDWIGVYKALEWIHGGLFAAIGGGAISLAVMFAILPLFGLKK
jgi:hypothetical protein